MNPHDTVVKAQKLAQRLFEERMLVVTPRDSMLHRFNESATFIWELLEEPVSAVRIAGELRKHFEGVDKKSVTREVCAFLDALLEKKLIRIHHGDMLGKRRS